MNRKYNNYLIMANDFLYKGKYDSAQKSFEKAYFYALTDKEKIDALYEVADICLMDSEYQRAYEIYCQIIKLNEKEIGAYYGKAICFDYKNDLNSAIENFKKAIEIDYFYDRAHYYLACDYDRLNMREEAIRELKICIELDPYDYVSYSDLGAFYEESKEYEKALFYINKSLEIANSYGRALYNKGVVFSKMKNKKEALKAYYLALDNSNDQDIYLNISVIYIENKDFEKSADILLEGISENPNSVNLHYNLACTFENLNRRQDAKKHLREAIKLNKDALLWAKKDKDLKKLVLEEKW